MLSKLTRRLGGAVIERRTSELGAAYLALARVNRIDNEAVIEFRAKDVWKATANTHRRIRDSVDGAAVTLTNALAAGLPITTAAARYAAAAALGSEEYHDRARRVLDGLGGEPAQVGRAVFDFWTQPLSAAAEQFSAINSRVALTHAPVEAAASRWSTPKPNFAGDLVVLGKSGAVRPRDALAVAELLIGHGRNDDAEKWLASTDGSSWGRALTTSRDELLALNRRALDAGTEPAAPRTLAVFDDDARSAPSTTLPIARVDRVHNRYSRLGDDTWLIASGPHLEPGVGGVIHFPYHAAIAPVFVGWQCRDVDLLTPGALEYLTANGPVGCADEQTEQILAAFGVPAFVSGPRARLTVAANTALGAVVTSLEAGAPPEDVRRAWRSAVADAVETSAPLA